MTLLVNVTDLQLKLGNFDERHDGKYDAALSPSSKPDNMQQISVNTFFLSVDKYKLMCTQQRHLLNMKFGFFLNHTLHLVCVLTLKWYNS